MDITSITINLSRGPSPTRVRAAAVCLSGLHASHHLRLHDPNDDARVFHIEHAPRPHIENADTSSSDATISSGATTPSDTTPLFTPSLTDTDTDAASNASTTPSSPSSTSPNPPTSPHLPASFTIPPARPPRGPHVTFAADTTPGGRAHTWLPIKERAKAERLAMAEHVARRAAIEAQGGPARSKYRFDSSSSLRGPWQRQFVGPSVDYFSLEGVAGPSGTTAAVPAASAQEETVHGGDSDEESSEGPSDVSDYPSDASSTVEAGPSRNGGRPGTPHLRVGRLEREKDSLSFRIEE